MARMFGTDGVRGVAGSELTIELATKLGQAGAYVLTKEQEHQATIIVGCDTRISGGMLASALMAGICSVGANAIFVGVMPTPAIAYLTRKHKVDAGVVISASHNPMEVEDRLCLEENAGTDDNANNHANRGEKTVFAFQFVIHENTSFLKPEMSGANTKRTVEQRDQRTASWRWKGNRSQRK